MRVRFQDDANDSTEQLKDFKPKQKSKRAARSASPYAKPQKSAQAASVKKKGKNVVRVQVHDDDDSATHQLQNVIKNTNKKKSLHSATPYEKVPRDAPSGEEERYRQAVVKKRMQALRGRTVDVDSPEAEPKKPEPPSPAKRRVKKKRKAQLMGVPEEIEKRSGLSRTKRDRRLTL